MHRTLLVTNDFPPRPGGIQSYLEVWSTVACGENRRLRAALAWRQPRSLRHRTALRGRPPSHDTDAADTDRSPAGSGTLVRAHRCDTVWFGAAAPLATLGRDRAPGGASRVIASTHGHEVGWSMLPAGPADTGHDRRQDRCRHLRQRVHAWPVRGRVRPAARIGTCAARRRRRTFQAGPRCAPDCRERYELGDRLRRSCVCHDWFRARARTC